MGSIRGGVILEVEGLRKGGRDREEFIFGLVFGLCVRWVVFFRIRRL